MLTVRWVAMTLPNADHAIVEEQKIADYLLDAVHPENSGKARFFLGLGFSAAEWEDLADALRDHAKSAHSVQSVESKHGTKYIVDGPIQSPSGTSANIRSIWIVDAGEDVPRLVTAYPKQ